jgi:ABC-type nickel/cobalt efflux system permease component RcnA
MKKLLIIFLVLLAGCAKQPEKLDVTGFSSSESLVINKNVKKPIIKELTELKKTSIIKTKKAISQNHKSNFVLPNLNTNTQINNNYLADINYQNTINLSLKEKIQQKSEISELFAKINARKNELQSVSILKPETPILEQPVNLVDLNAELPLKQKIYNLTLKPIQKQIIKWNIFINKQINKYMKQLKNKQTLWVILVSLFAAFIYGVLHTLGPGHGKMVVVTYFLTQKASFLQGILLGLQTAFAHVMGAIVLIFATNIVLHSFILNPEDHLHLLKSISFGLIIAVGFIMLVKAILHIFGKANAGCSKCNHAHHNHNHNHNHNHEHKHQNTKTQSFIALAIGCVPCTGSLLILLYAMANNMLILGLIMVIFVALGMATAMIILGFLAILGKQKILDKKFTVSKNGHKYTIILEFIGALFIILLGSLMFFVNYVN